MESIMALTREQFGQNLAKGTEAVRRNSVQFCWNDLPIENRYFILLNSSFDGNPLAPGEHIFPNHDWPQADTQVARTADEVVERLWRDGKIPEWIDITPYEAEQDLLYFELRCCGRFTANEAHLYHKQEGYPPFHKFGPIEPVGYRGLELDGKFDLHCYRDRKRKT